jgi:hypothetical protein
MLWRNVMRWSDLASMKHVGDTTIAGHPAEVWRASDGRIFQVRRDVGVFREVRAGESLGDFERWDLLMPDQLGHPGAQG